MGMDGKGSSVVERRTRGRKVAPVRIPAGAVRQYTSPGSIFCADSIWYPFHPRVTAVARKRSRSFCPKCRCQVTVKHTCTLRMRLWIKWYWCMVVMVYTERTPRRQQIMWHQPRNNQQRCKHTTSRNIPKRDITDDSRSFKITCDKSAVSRE